MGKQINYWMDYESFLLVAKKAVDLGIYRELIKIILVISQEFQ